jgi:DNA-binding CsgD family transcriptional regulator
MEGSRAAVSGGDRLAQGWAALRAAEWETARACFQAAARETDAPEASDGLGVALWWLNEIRAAHEARTGAYLGYKARGEVARAARIAAWLAREQVFLDSNGSAMNGWFARAEQLLAGAGPCAERAWVGLYRASMYAPPEELAEAARVALLAARDFVDANLEAVALAFGGMAAVRLGRAGEGLHQLDAAMAMATSGETDDLMATSEIFCFMLSACELAGDLVRCEHWCRVAADFAERRRCPFLAAYCRTTYGSLQTLHGRWSEAEATLTEAIRAFDAGHRGLRVHATLKLADLYVNQGRLEAAEVLLTGFEDFGAAVIPLARLHLARGEFTLARALLEQALDDGAVTPNQIPLLLLLVEATLAGDDGAAAERAAERLTEGAAQTGSDFLLAQAELARGQVRRARGDVEALASFRAALARLGAYEQSLIAARARYAMAETLRESDWAGAVTWARAALASFERIGAAREADRAAFLLRELGAGGRSAPRRREGLSQREGEVLALLAHGLTNREIGERLFISPKTVERHMTQILGKLGLRSRAEAAAFAVGGGE